MIERGMETKSIETLENRVLRISVESIAKAIESELIGYNKPLSDLTKRVIQDHEVELYSLLNGEFSNLLRRGDFKTALKKALTEKLAKVLIARMGGELESRVNELKSDPTTRARITLAIEEIVNG